MLEALKSVDCLYFVLYILFEYNYIPFSLWKKGFFESLPDFVVEWNV